MNAFTIRLHHWIMIASTAGMNSLYWCFRPLRIKSTIRERNGILVKSLADVKSWMHKFTWTKESGDWRPWIMTMLSRGMKDDCDGAAAFAKFLFNRMGHKADTLGLWRSNSRTGHDVCWCYDLGVLVSNNEVITYKGDDWKDFILSSFGYDYDIIECKGKIIHRRES